MSDNISDRINEIIEHYNYNVSSFSRAIGLTNNVTIGRIIKENRKPSFEIIEAILQTFGSINANWLITGQGEMIKSEELVTTGETDNEMYERLIKQYEDRIKDLALLIHELTESRDQYKMLYNLYKDKFAKTLPPDV